MKRLNLLAALIFILFIVTIVNATEGSNEICDNYSKYQVDSLISAEVERQVDTQLITLKIKEASNDTLKTYISEENKHISLIAIIISSLVAIVGIVIPLILNQAREENLKRREKEIDAIIPLTNEVRFLTSLTRALSNTDIDVRIFSLSQAIREHANTPYVSYAHNCRGCEYDDIKEYKKAKEDYTKAIELNPNFAEAYNNRGNVFCDEGDANQALKDYSKAIELNPNYATAYCNRANVFIQRKMYKEAKSDIEIAIKLSPYSDKAFMRYANLLLEQKDLKGALKKINKAIKLNDAEWGHYFLRSFILEEDGQYLAALNDIIECLRIAQQSVRDKKIINDLQEYLKHIESLLEPNIEDGNTTSNEDVLNTIIKQLIKYLAEIYKDNDGSISI